MEFLDALTQTYNTNYTADILNFASGFFSFLLFECMLSSAHSITSIKMIYTNITFIVHLHNVSTYLMFSKSKQVKDNYIWRTSEICEETEKGFF